MKSIILALFVMFGMIITTSCTSEMAQQKEVETKTQYLREIDCETEEQCAEEAIIYEIENQGKTEDVANKLSCKAVITDHYYYANGYYAGTEVYEGTVTCGKKRYHWYWENGTVVYIYPIP